MQVVGDDLGLDREQALEVLDALRETSSASPSSSGRRCGGRPRRDRRLARQNVLFSSAPQPSTGPRRGERQGDAAPARSPRERRRMQRLGAQGRVERARSTESSVRMWIGRSWTRKASAIGRSRSRASSSSVGDRLVGDVARGHHQRRADVREQQVVKRRVGQHHARGRASRARPRGATSAPGRRRATTIGRSRSGQQAPPRPRSARPARGRPRGRPPSARTACPRGACARAAPPPPPRRSATAGEVVAADPLDRDDRARAEHRRGGLDRVAAGALADPRPVGVDAAGPAARTRGRRWAGRGSGGRAGSSYSARQRSHISKPAIVVSGRS